MSPVREGNFLNTWININLPRKTLLRGIYM